jgi:hypothetical protein
VRPSRWRDHAAYCIRLDGAAPGLRADLSCKVAAINALTSEVEAELDRAEALCERAR